MELAHEMKVLKEELDELKVLANPKKDLTPTCQMTTEISQPSRHQRHSLIGLFTGEGHHGSKSAPNVDHSHSHLKRRLFKTMQFIDVLESSTSTSHVSTPNQVSNTSTSDAPDTNINGSSTPVNAPDRSSQRSSVSDDPAVPLPKSDSLMFHKAHKLRFVSSVEFRHSSGETSTTPLSPGSPVDDSSGEIYPNKSRLQRVKPQSRKTFRLRRSRKSSRAEASHIKLECEVATASLQHPDIGSPPLTPVITTQPAVDQPAEPAPVSGTPTPTQEQKQLSDSHRLRIATRGKSAEGSWDEDSAISQTSSTSGYRESYPVMHLKESLETSPKAFPPLASPDVHSLPSTSSATTTNNFLHLDNSSPDCSLNENGEKTALLGHAERSSSQHSLLMVFEQQDETTFI
ncbi:hypothetical protein NQ317_014803 [Molorchus minor]|uniref:Uncharacterized protein n=1 Tax=Molorchus minor TaxID=1323400 RepID=A0ABQ9JWL0_9CUCU|nr:hypothetical protein NQ317_014803 [Molorchus minor]